MPSNKVRRLVRESMERCRDEAERGGAFHHRTASTRNTRPNASTNPKIEGHITDVMLEGHDREMENWSRRIAAYKESGRFIFLEEEKKRVGALTVNQDDSTA